MKSLQKGITLIEAMITIALISIIALIAVPNFQSFFENSRVRTATNGFISATQLARSEAIKRGVNVIVCRRNNTGSACDNNSDWTNGWLVITTDATPEVIQVWEPLRNNVSMILSTNNVVYQPSGRVVSASSASVNIKDKPNLSRCISVQLGGRAGVVTCT